VNGVSYADVTERDEVGVVVDDSRKNRNLHRSQRNGLTKIKAKILLSMIPLRRDLRTLSLQHRGQIMVAILS
jgi:hypothetical protein